MLFRVLSVAVLVLAGAAVVLSTRDRRSRTRLPVTAFVLDTFPWSSGLVLPSTLAVAAGAVVVAGPAAFFAAMGGVSWVRVDARSGSVAALGLATLAVKILLAATEELVFRGALVEQIARRTTLGVGVVGSSVLFALAHLSRPDAQGPLAVAVFFLDGLGFSFAYLATGSLWVPTCWHAAKNVAIWLLYSRGTLQFTDGLFRAHFGHVDPWVGGPSTTGLVDVIVTAFVVTVAVRLAIRRAQLALKD